MSSRESSSLGPERAGASIVGANRSQLILLHTLVMIVLCYELLFSKAPLLEATVNDFVMLGLVLTVAGLLALPARLWKSGWIVGGLVIGDTVITTGIIYLSGNAGSDLYLSYFLILLIAAFSPTLWQMIAFTVLLCGAYGVILYLGAVYSGSLSEGHLLRIPVLLVMATFYWATTEAVRVDIAKRKRAEELLRTSDQMRQSQKLEAVGRLAGGIAHDFNNLLTIISGYSQLLLNRFPPDDPSHSEVEEIKKAGDRAASLIRQLLAFSRKQVLEPEVLDLNAVVVNFDKMLRRLIGEDIEMVTILDPKLQRVKVDRGQIEQVIMNLAVNARDAMPKGGKLVIETANVDFDESYAKGQVSVQSGPYVMLAVSDTGHGMDEDTQAHIFEPFFTTKEPGKGTGLGLSTVYGIVKQSGGYIFVYSEPGEGAAFKVYLPAEMGSVKTIKPNRTPTGLPQGSETVLLVEDESAVRTLARSVLEANGYRVLEARRGEEALQISAQHLGPIHLLLSDVVMPGISGRDLAAQLMSLRPGMETVYMSGYTDEAIVHHGVLDPGTAYLPKPFTPEALIHKVRQVLDSRSQGFGEVRPAGDSTRP